MTARLVGLAMLWTLVAACGETGPVLPADPDAGGPPPELDAASPLDAAPPVDALDPDAGPPEPDKPVSLPGADDPGPAPSRSDLAPPPGNGSGRARDETAPSDEARV